MRRSWTSCPAASGPWRCSLDARMIHAIRKRAIDRGLDFIYRTACKPRNFKEYGFDYLGCFHGVASTSKDRKLRKKALDLGRERALEWRRRNARVPRKPQPDDITNLVFG